MTRREELIANCQHYTGTLFLHGKPVSLEELVGFAFDEGFRTGARQRQPKPYKLYAVAVRRPSVPGEPWEADTPPYAFVRPGERSVCLHEVRSQTAAGARAKAITACKRHAQGRSSHKPVRISRSYEHRRSGVVGA